MKTIDKDRLQMYISITRVTIILCWLSLFSFWIVKLFCNEVFEIAVQNENFIKFSELLQSTWLKYLVSLFTISFTLYFLFCSTLQIFAPKGKDILLYILYVFVVWITVNFINIEILEMLCGYFIIILISLFKQNGHKKLLGALGVVLDFVFCTISMLTRNIELNVIQDCLVMAVLSIDVNIMFALYYLYTNLLKLKKELK